MPSWAAKFTPQIRVTIDACVNAHAGINHDKSQGQRDTGNLLAIVGMIERRLRRENRSDLGRAAELQSELARIARTNPNEPGSTPKRRALALKWARKLGKQYQARYCARAYGE